MNIQFYRPDKHLLNSIFNMSSSVARKVFIGGNWKMNGSKSLIASYSEHLKSAQYNASAKNSDVVIGCPAIYLETMRNTMPHFVAVAAQNCYLKESGAFTGETSTSMLKDCNIHWVIIGHSERRQLFSETSELVAQKTAFAINNGLKVILCIGETLQEREAGKTFDVVTSQLEPVKKELATASNWKNVVIAYEPVWAIGTGKVATEEQAQEVHVKLRQWLASSINQEIANTTRIIYGGSVSASNCQSLIKQKDIDGFLVGGASLKPVDFVKIINCQGDSRPSSRRNSQSSK